MEQVDYSVQKVIIHEYNPKDLVVDVGASSERFFVILQGRIDICQYNTARFAYQAGKLEAQITGSARQIQHRLAGSDSAEFYGKAFNQAVGSQRHDVVHDIVLAGYRIKYLGDQAGFLLHWHRLITEMGGLIGVGGIGHGVSGGRFGAIWVAEAQY